MRHFVLLVTMLLGVAAAQEPEKAEGTITSKTEGYTGQQWVNFQTPDDKDTVCYLAGMKDKRFRDFRAGDYIKVTGYRRGKKMLHDCVILVWKSPGTN